MSSLKNTIDKMVNINKICIEIETGLENLRSETHIYKDCVWKEKGMSVEPIVRGELRSSGLLRNELW
jgi:hypothetical protein